MDTAKTTSGSSIDADVARVIVDAQRITARIEQLAGQIAECYEGREVTLLAILTGSLIFLADLVRRLPIRARLDVALVRSYPGSATRSQGPTLRLPPEPELKGCDVLIVDDILDSGGTLRLLCDTVSRMKPASVRTCVLLRKDRTDVVDRAEPDFVGFDVADEFVVGYGLDYNGLYRNLPDICVLNDQVLQRAAGGTSA